MIYDVILVAIFITFAIIGYFRGAAKALIGIVVSFVAYAVASIPARLVSGWIYNTMIAPAVHDSVVNTVQSTASGVSDQASALLPGWLSGLLQLSGADIPGTINAAGADLSETAATGVNSVVEPLVSGFLSMILTIGFFFLIRFLLLKLAVIPLIGISKLKVLSTLNKALGAALGLAEAFVVVSMLAYLLRLILPYIHGDAAFLNESTIYNSFIFYYFYSGNIFAALTGWIS